MRVHRIKEASNDGGLARHICLPFLSIMTLTRLLGAGKAGHCYVLVSIVCNGAKKYDGLGMNWHLS